MKADLAAIGCQQPLKAVLPLVAASGERCCGSETASEHRRRASKVRLIGRFRHRPASSDDMAILAGAIGRRSLDQPGRKNVADGISRE